MGLILGIILAGGGYAHAACFDPDADGAGTGTTCTIVGDCDQGDASIHPGAPEDGTDWVDEDCDDSPMIRRAYVVGFEANYTTDWSTTGSVTLVAPGVIRLQPTATTGAGIALKDDFTWKKGRVTVNVRLTEAPTTACSVVVAGPTTSYTQSLGTPTGAETVSVEFPGILPGQSITDVKLSCAGAGSARVDWLTIQNGPYTWGPLMDISSSFSTMGLPGGGHQEFVRMSEGADPDVGLRFMGGDVGGVAWSEDGYNWYTANGTQDDLNTQALGGVWDAWSPGEIGGEWFTAILVGNRPGGENGGLFYTDDITHPLQAWTMVPGPAGAPAGDGGIGATKWDDECTPAANIASSGKLIVEDWAHDGLLLIGSTTAAYPGIWAWDWGNPTAPPFEAVDPAYLPADVEPVISALALIGDHLIVGYRVACGGDPEGAGHASMLFDCDDTLGASAGPMTCVPILDDTDGTAPLDVRDIEVVPDAPLTGDGTLVLYVADGGRRWDGAATTAGEGTVYEVRISPSGGYSVADTDTQASLPTWAVDASGAPVSTYRAAGNCGQDSGGTLGDLVAPEGDTSNAEGRDLVTILLTPEADALFAFYPQDSGERDYGCVRVFRAPLDGTLPLAWTPFQGWEGGAMKWDSTSHPLARRNAVENYGAFFDAEPLAEVWALASVYDAAWEFPVAGETEVSLLAQGMLAWRVFAKTDVRNGWDTPWPSVPTSEVLDDLAIELAWDGAGESFQNSQGRDVTVVRGAPLGGVAGGYGDAVIGGGNGDWKLGILHGRIAAGTREPADRPCPISMWRTAAAYSVAAWSDPTGATDPELWAGIVVNDGDDEDTAGDEGRKRGVVHADDAYDLDDPTTWCWDTFARGISGLPNNYVKDISPADGIYELLCQDSGDLGTVVPWNTCDQFDDEDDSFDMTYADIGNLYRLVAVDRDYAIGAAAPATLDDGAIGGEGLWVIHHDGINGLTYTHVTFPGGVSCTEAAAFDETSGYQLTVDEEALVAAGGSGDVILYVTSHHNNTIGCGGAWQVTLNYLGAAPTASWTEITPGSTTCPFAPYDIYGARPTRDGRFVYLWGGDGINAVSGVCRVDLTGASATELAFPATPYLAVVDVLPHPHLDDVIFVGTNGGNQDDVPASGDGGLYLAQRRFRPGIHPPAGGEFWAWGSKKFGYYDLEERRIAALDWGTGWGAYPGPDPDDPADDQLTNLYLAAYGGGWWDGALEVE